MAKLYVYMNHKHVGDLIQSSSKTLSFQYSLIWLREHSDFPISYCMPVREKPYANEEVIFYFDNLFPDIKYIRERLARSANSKSTETFDMLGAIGRDCIGALQFFIEKPQSKDLKFTQKAKALTSKNIEKMLIDLKNHPLGVTEHEEFRISLAGAQDKTALLRKKKKWYLPKASTATTHILKPNIGHLNAGMDWGDSVENEWLCLNICKAFGLRTATVEIAKFGNTKTLVVERFDRKNIKNKIYRLPQEDFCQALGLSTFRKYQSDGGPGLKEICYILKLSNESYRDRYDFIKAQLVFWLLAAIDGHAKNFSLQIVPGGFELAPLYDVLSAEPLIHKRQMSAKKIKMAMKIGKPGHYKVDEIYLRHWLQLEKHLGLPKGLVEKAVEDVIRLEKNLTNTISFPKGFPEDVFDPILSGVEKRIKRLKNA